MASIPNLALLVGVLSVDLGGAKPSEHVFFRAIFPEIMLSSLPEIKGTAENEEVQGSRFYKRSCRSIDPSGGRY